MFEMRVENRGSGDVVARVYVTDIHLLKGERIPRIDSKQEVHWRGLRGGEQMRLFGHQHGYAGVLSVDEVMGMPLLEFATPAREGDAAGTYGKVPVLPTEIISQHREGLILTLRVDFHDSDGKTLKTRVRRFLVAPDPNSEVHFHVTSAWGPGWLRSCLKRLGGIARQYILLTWQPPARFVGRWQINGDDSTGEAPFFITLRPSFEAYKSNVPLATGRWEIVGEDARITWSDGWRNLLRPQEGNNADVVGFSPGTSWENPPANTLRAVKR
jgi:hypothetical protein